MGRNRKDLLTPEAWARVLESNRQSRIRLQQDPERRAKRNARQAKYRAERIAAGEKHKVDSPRGPRVYSPEEKARRNAQQAEYRRAWSRQRRDEANAYLRAYRAKLSQARGPKPEPAPSGSVLATAAPSEFRDLLAAISALAPRYDDRDEIIAEACLLALDGMPVPEAVQQARRSVLRAADVYRYAKPLHDGHWL